MSNTRWAPLVVATSLFLSTACCPKAGLTPPPRAPLAVDVTAEPGPATVYLGQTSLGSTPSQARLNSLSEVAALSARRGDEVPMEQRVRTVSESEYQVLFRFTGEPTAVAKKLGLTRVLVFDFSDRVLFDFGKSDLKAESLPILARQAAVLRDSFPGVEVYVCGHTDDVGGEEPNLKLSLARAEAVAGELEKDGLPRSRMRISGLGEGFPIAPNESDAGRAMNRRTELVLPR
ncbi:MAG: hypothetical protein DIJKHBIC_03887 [Thermoanaerobaculia bacterium]|nr:hypothetical protein [Thermoanaerobaculia bacterium]